VSLARDPQRALRQLKVVRDRLWWSAEPDRRAALEASVAYLEYRLGRQSIDNATRQLAQCLKASGPSREVLMMLASLYNESEDAKELKRLLDANTGVLPPAQLDLLQSRLACLQGDIDRGAQLAVQAADSDTFGTDAAGWAASLLGETSGDYARAVEIAGRTYDKNPDLYLLNSLAFVSALAGRHREATKAIAEAGGREVLPFHGATAALVDLAAGRLEEGLAGYQQAVDGIRRGGDPEMAGLVDWRRRLATRQLGWPLPSGENLDEPPGSKYRVVRATLRRVAGRLEEPKR